MKLPLLTLAALCLASPPARRSRNLAEQGEIHGRQRDGQEIRRRPRNPQPDPELQKLVDQTPEGAIFRKDLPFPNKMEVKVTRREEVSGRFSEKSELGSQVNTLKGTITNVSKLTRNGDKVSYTLLESSFTEPVIEGHGKESKKPVSQATRPAVGSV